MTRTHLRNQLRCLLLVRSSSPGESSLLKAPRKLKTNGMGPGALPSSPCRPSCWRRLDGHCSQPTQRPACPVPGRLPALTSRVGRGRKLTHLCLRFSPSGRGFRQSGAAAAPWLRSPAQERQRGTKGAGPWCCGCILRAGGACERGPGYGSPSHIIRFPPRAMTRLEQPLKRPLHFRTGGRRPVPPVCTGTHVPLC